MTKRWIGIIDPDAGVWRNLQKMVEIGYHASHEQFAPSDLIDCVKAAEAARFAAAMCSDLFHPWSEQQGESGFA